MAVKIAGVFNASPCEIQDISGSGMRCSEADELPVGTLAEVSFVLPEEHAQLFRDTGERTIGMNATVKWCRKEASGRCTIGVEVLHIPEAVQQRFFTYLYHGLLSSVAIFRGVSDEAISALAGKIAAEVYRPGQVIVEEASPGTSFYMVSSGSVVRGSEHPLRSLLREPECDCGPLLARW